MTLEQAYNSITSYVPKNSVESLQVLKQIQEYWNLWKPAQTNVLLLAESHVYTSENDFEVRISKIKQDYFLPNYPTKFVRLVYCLGYGEKDLLNKEVESNSGTFQFWQIFCSCVAKSESEYDLGFSRMLKTTPYFGRLRNKVNILNELKRRGIWLIDASIVGIYKGSITDDLKERIFHTSWDMYVRDVVAGAHPKYVIVIGKYVYNALNVRLESLSSKIGFKCKVLNQPQGDRVSREEQLETYREYQRICSKDAP
ncbi:MAG: hypothetical protein ABSF44_06790 [Candidatus Bathyarchaeia archaeon]|jgi:hypothetical protein